MRNYTNADAAAAASATSNGSSDKMPKIFLPKRIILLRHGQSQGNTDEKIFGRIADHRVPLTEQGIEEAQQAGSKIRDVVSEEGKCDTWKAYFYVSPYERTRRTLKEIGRSFPENRIIGVREECKVREQDFGNFQDYDKMKELKVIRDKFGRFFYRFPEGESGADVYDRVSSFLESFWRDIYMKRISHDSSDEVNIVIVSHGLTIRFFLMKWFKWTVEQFETLKNPKNCEFRVLQLGPTGEYSLAIHHDEKTLGTWGLSPEMIEDQKLRANGGDWNERKPSYLKSFFDTYAHEEDNGDKK